MSHPTLRAILGATPPNRIVSAQTALLVIDIQKEYYSGRLPIPDGHSVLQHANQLIDWADDHNLPVFQIQHLTPAGSPIFAEDSPTVSFHPALHVKPHHTVLKKTSVSVFPTTDIETRLKNAGIRTLVITGLMTHACVAGATRDANLLGYEVIVASDASATRNIDIEDTQHVAHATLHQATLATLADAFGDVMTTAAILTLPIA
ncbi:isochorismatase family protein [Chitinivorax sp. B]|uniref:cysteine hydrolase family protein n=1 Tax=Chitinivorax sp. B TaxID=2502235 RepID=UPI0010F578A1|nr:isochorismatase family protein [Chitinivorax sp. B]